MSLSRAEVERMDRDDLVDAVVDLSEAVADLRDELNELKDHTGRQQAELHARISDVEAMFSEDISSAEDRFHHERSKLARRVSALEDEVGVSAADAVAIAEGGTEATQLTKLGRLVRHGPEAAVENPGPTAYRAKALVDNWNRWGTVRDDALGKERRLASKEHDLKTRLEDVREESLQWAQVYRTMEKIAAWSEGTIELRDESEAEGKYVLVHHLEGSA